MIEIQISECKTVELSVDKVAKILFYKNRVFRVITKEYTKQVEDMLNSGLIEELVQKNLFPETWISDVKIGNYQLVIEHKAINNWNYPYEWSFDMLKDAGLMILKVNKIANKYGYELLDAHAYNVVFNMSRPQYIDFGSFMKIDKSNNKSWKSYTIFYNHFYIPLYLWSKGYSDIARNIFLMEDYFNEVEFFKIKHPCLNLFGAEIIFDIYEKIRTVSLSSKQKIKQKLNNPIKQKVALFLNKIFGSKFSSLSFEKDISNFVKPIESSMWNDYHDNIDAKTYKRFIKIRDIISNLKDAKSVIELASNQGKFAESILKYTDIKKIIATDYDKEALNIMYLNNKNRDDFLPLLFDFVRTNGRKSDKELYDRIKSDIVIALAVTHHLILTQNIPIEYIFSTMQKLTNKYIIIEFMPMGLYSGDINNIPEVPGFYNLSWFNENFIKYFDLILDEKLENNRHVFVGKLKNEN